MTEKRKHPRRQIELAAKCELADGSSFDGTIKDISLGGVFVALTSEKQLPKLGSELTLHFRIGQLAELRDHSEELHLPATVRWTKDSGFGVQFGLLGVRDTHVLVHLVEDKNED